MTGSQRAKDPAHSEDSIHPLRAFLSELALHPRQMGTVWPSSRTLARASLQAISDSVDPKGRFALALAEEIAGLKESIGFVDFGSTTGPYQAALEAELAGFRCRGGTASERAAMANVAKQRAAALDRFIDEQEMPRKPCDFYSHFHYTVEQALESVLGVKKTSSW